MFSLRQTLLINIYGVKKKFPALWVAGCLDSLIALQGKHHARTEAMAQCKKCHSQSTSLQSFFFFSPHREKRGDRFWLFGFVFKWDNTKTRSTDLKSFHLLVAEQLLIPLRPSPRTRIYCRRNTTSNAILYLFTGFTFSCLPGETVHMLLFCSPNPKVCRRNLVLSPLLQVSQAFMQVLFKTLTNQVLHWLVLPINIAIL